MNTHHTGCPRSGKKSGEKYFFKVRELSGNFEICQGILEFKSKSGNYEVTSLLMIKASRIKAKAISPCLDIIIIIIFIILIK